MKSKGLPLMITLFFLLAVRPAVQAAAGQTEPRARFEQTVYAFATVIAGTHVSHRFDILNKGGATLNIIGVYAA